MADEKEKTQRRVYVLPTELVERILTYQNDMGLQSEVEAARRLLDEALKRRDSAFMIVRRFQERLRGSKLMADIAKDVLMGHPLLSTLSVGEKYISFTLSTGDDITIFEDGTATMKDRHDQSTHLDANGKDTEIPF